MITEEEALVLDIQELTNFCNRLIATWGKVKRMSLNDRSNRDLIWIKELIYIIEKVAIPIEVMATQEQIHPGYALEKLETAAMQLKSTIEYFQRRNKEKKSND